MTVLAELHDHPHARAVLGGAVPPAGSPSHAYLFHGPAGAGKRAAALAFAAELLADGAPDAHGARRRVRARVHPDLTWVTPSGAAGMLVDDVDEAVIGAVSHTPFEARRRVFVLERADSMNDSTANRMLKTLEEPPPFAHLVLLTDRPSNVLPTIASRCQSVRFEAPSAEAIAQRLQTGHGVPPEGAQACARLALGDADRALALALGEGPRLRQAGERFARACLAGNLRSRPQDAVLEIARDRGNAALAAEQVRVGETVDLLPAKERRRAEREGDAAAKRLDRRARAESLDCVLQLAGLWLRDVACILDDAPELVFHSDRADALAADAAALRDPRRAREAVALIEETRTTFVLNPTEELALEALSSRVERVLVG